jgi:cytochrome P450
MKEELPIWNPFKDNFKQNSSQFLAEIRLKNPTHRSIGGQWFFSRYEDVRNILVNNTFDTVDIKQVIVEKGVFRNDGKTFDAIYNSAIHWFMFMNAPDHMATRKVVASFWNDYKLDNLIDEVIDSCFESINEQDQIDFAKSFAEPISTKIMCYILGFSEQDSEYLMKVSHDLLKIVEPFNSIYSYIQENDMAIELSNYLDGIIVEKKQKRDNSMISNLIFESTFSDNEVKSVIQLLLFTGMESSTYFLTTSFYHLLTFPNAWAEFRQNTENINVAIEELIRHVSITKCVFRKANNDIQLGGVLIEKGEIVIVSLESANYDDTIFENPTELNLNRKPNPHMAFGYGFHSCLGAKIARLEGQKLFKRLAESSIDFNLSKENPPVWRKNILIGGLANLPLNISNLK